MNKVFWLLGIVAVLSVFSVTVRLIVCNPVATVTNAVVDFINYLRHMRWNELQTGQLIAYTALFGRGKTLSVVHYVVGKYEKYNDKRIYDIHRRSWVTQKVHIISNVHLNGIPYEQFDSLEQVVSAAERFRAIDELQDTLTCILVLGDEFSVQMNSREFKKNIDPLFLNTLLTCRHHHISLIYDAQRFNHVDALLRQVTSSVIECKKVWRFVYQYEYDAYMLENAQNPALLQPLRRFGWFCRNRDFARYDTLACVGNLKKTMESGGMLTEQEILDLQRNSDTGMDGVLTPSKRYKKMRKKIG